MAGEKARIIIIATTPESNQEMDCRMPALKVLSDAPSGVIQVEPCFLHPDVSGCFCFFITGGKI
ncbi:MAG: hypothetical protein IKI34_03230 [Eubacterium sp.]|nr:hypothetical protein [Eubacterium sp.]